MSLKLKENLQSSDMLKSLEEVKTTEFGKKQITLEDVPQLNGTNKRSSHNLKILTPKRNADNINTKTVDKKQINSVGLLEKYTTKSCVNNEESNNIISNGSVEISRKVKRRRSSSDVEILEVKSNSANQVPKKQKNNDTLEINIMNDTQENETDLGWTSDSIIRKQKKAKAPTEEELKIKREQQVQYLQGFVNISLKYSQFLEKKIATAEPSGSFINEDAPIKNERKDITNQLKFFEGSLRPYQVEGVTWLTVLFENSVNGILADEMGLGKTIQIIALFCHLYERRVAGPFLVVAPLSTLANWESEFKRFAPCIPVVRLQGSEFERKSQMRRIDKPFLIDGRKVRPVVICSYQTPLFEERFLQTFTWQYVVVDEGHRIKNPDSKLSQELRNLKAVNRTLLTGTPLQNNIRELWALFNFLMPELFKDIEGFSSLLELEDMKDRDKLLQNEAQTKVISTIHKVLAPFMLRREKKFVLDDIVPKKEVIIYCPLTEMQKYLYRAVLQFDVVKLTMGKQQPESNDEKAKRRCRLKKVHYNYEEMWEKVFNDDYSLEYMSKQQIVNKNFLRNKENVPFDCPDVMYMCQLTMTNTVMMLKKIVNHPYLVWCPIDPNMKNRQLYVDESLIKHSGKLQILDALLPKLKAGGHKVLIFSTLVMFMDMIEEMLIMRNYNFTRLDGSTKYDSRKENIEGFMSDPNIFIFLLSTRAGGLGLNLTAADTVIFMDRDWNPMADTQAQDRCHRIGQTRPVMIYSLITKGTIDEVILARGDMKKRLEKIVIKEGQFKTMKKNFTDNELQELENLLNTEEKLLKINANGLIYTDEELENILDRSELIKDMEKSAKERKT